MTEKDEKSIELLERIVDAYNRWDFTKGRAYPYTEMVNAIEEAAALLRVSDEAPGR